METQNIERISHSEWEIMRIVWTLGNSTSHQMIDILSYKKGWKASTVKTLVTRLTKKDFLTSKKDGRKNIYYAAVNEQKAANLAANDLFNDICEMHAGDTINNVINNTNISKKDIDMLINNLNQKKQSAPDKIDCNCLGFMKDMNIPANDMGGHHCE